MRKFIDNIALVFLAGFLIIGVGYSVYDSAIKDNPIDVIHNNMIRACKTEQTRSALDVRFALEAAEARRRNAETLADHGMNIKAQNEIATAKEYEIIAEDYRGATVKNCNEEYPSP